LLCFDPWLALLYLFVCDGLGKLSLFFLAYFVCPFSPWDVFEVAFIVAGGPWLVVGSSFAF